MVFNKIKLRAGDKLYPVEYAVENGKMYFKFRYNKTIMEEIKNMSGSHWCGFDTPPLKLWSVSDNQRNRFQLIYLQGGNPYELYDKELPEVATTRPLRLHQLEMVKHGLTRHYCIIAGEMGLGKTLAGIEIMEQSGFTDWWWVAPKSALKSVKLELIKWGSRIQPRLLTYDELKTAIKKWQNGTPAPHGVFFDESARIKNRTSQRSQAAAHLANAVRDEHGDAGYVILMSGTPAPKAPTDWWHQSEVACPGFLREGDETKLRYRLCLIENKESAYGGSYPHLITWWDDENKCKKCGKLAHEHDILGDHNWEASKNEITFLYERLKGLVLVKLKKDCLDLPEKIYRIIDCPPTPTMMRTASTIVNTSPSTIKALTLLRELSDGFQYVDVKTGSEVCALCNGDKCILIPDPSLYKDGNVPDSNVKMIRDVCPNCSGTGEQATYRRDVASVDTPKDEALIDLLEEHEDTGRIVIYAGFTGSIDKICKILQKQGWWTIRIDGTRSWSLTDAEGIEHDCLDEALMGMDMANYEKSRFEKLAVVGHPASGSEGLTFTASPSIVYYSNDFNGMYRMQSEDRIHRMGMDTNRGATIIDLLHLPSDAYVLNNLKLKKDLQNLSLGDLRKCYGTDNGNTIDRNSY